MWNLWDCSLWFNSKFNLTVAYPKSFDLFFSRQLFALTPKKLVLGTKTFLIKTFLLSLSILWGLKFFFLLFLCKTLSASFRLENLTMILFFMSEGRGWHNSRQSWFTFIPVTFPINSHTLNWMNCPMGTSLTFAFYLNV